MKFKLDFADTFRFPPKTGAGVAVLRLPRNFSLSVLGGLVRNLLTAIEREPISGRLWVVEIGRIRVHDETD